MPLVTPGDLHVNRELTNVMIAYQQDQAGFVAHRVFPNIPVEHQSDFFYKFDRKAAMQSQMKKRAPSTETPGVEWKVTKDTYFADVWGLHHDIEDQLRANADSVFQLDRTGTELLTQQAWIRREREWMNNFFVTGVWGRELTGVNASPSAGEFVQFDDQTFDLISFFRQENLKFKLNSGHRPNVAVFGAEVWDAILDHDQIVERVKYTQAGFLTEQIVARALGLGEILVADAIEATDDEVDKLVHTNPEDDAAFDTKFIGGKHVLLAYRAPRPSRDVPSAGYTFSWRKYGGPNAYGGRIKKFRMEPIASDRIEIESAYGMKVVAPEMGTLLLNAVP